MLLAVAIGGLVACQRPAKPQELPPPSQEAAALPAPDNTGPAANETSSSAVATPTLVSETPPAPAPPAEPPAPPFPQAGRRFVVGEAKDLPLPVVCRAGDLSAYSRTLQEKEGRPGPSDIPFEQLLNAFELRPNGTAAVAKGATVMAETLSCPWKPSATLLLIRVENGTDLPHDLTATLQFEPAAVARYRLLGTLDEPVAEGIAPTTLPAKSGTSLLVEMELRAPSPTYGQIQWTVDGAPAAPLKLARTPAAEPGDDARFAALLGAFSLWLANDQPEILDDAVVAGLARECVAENLPEDRKQALVLIARTLERK